MFVRQLCSQVTSPPCSVWVQHNLDTPRMRNVTANLRKWAEAIGEKLRLVELREKEMFVQLQTSGSDPCEPGILPREPVFPDENDSQSADGDGEGLCVSYALKMVACNLLLEITRFLRDIPPHFSPAAPVSTIGTPLVSRATDHRGSNTSMASLEADSAFHQTHQRTLSTEFKMPSLGNFGSSLSVEDAEPPEFGRQVSVEEFSLTSSLHKKRTSFYLHINTNSSGGGSLSRSLSRNASFKKPQARVVRVAETPTEVRTLARAAYTSAGSPSSRARRKSISSGVPRPRRPSILVTGNATLLSAGQPTYRRRKSVGAVLSQRSLQESDYLVPTTPSTPHTPGGSFFAAGGRTGSGGAATSLGNSLNVGFTKLKRSAQRAFRRHGTKTKGTSEPSPNASPGPSQRKRTTHRQSSADAYPKSPFHLSLSEESWRYYPWLDMVEHLVLVDTKEASVRNKEDCLKLVAALKKVYSRTYREEEEELAGRKGKRDSTWNQGRKQSSLGSLFIHRLTLHDNLLPAEEQVPPIAYNRGRSMPGRAIKRVSVQTPRSTSVQYAVYGGAHKQSQASPGKLSFANWNSNRFVTNYLASKISGVPSEETIQLTIEAESPFERTYLTAQSDKERSKYIESEFSGLVHVPFSTLVYAAPILHSRTFSILKGVAWDALLGLDEGLSQAAAAFFLLACAKEPEKAIKGFVTTRVLNGGALEQRWAIMRFKVLWDCRYGVWPRMQERAQKQLLNDKEKEVSGRERVGGRGRERVGEERE